MKALVKKELGFGNMALMEIPEPEAVDDLVKIKVCYAGICGSDLHTYEGHYPGTKPPVVLGHEFSGIVEAVGPLVKKVKPGDRVTSETTFSTCGVCSFCVNKEYNLCPDRQGLGTQVNGGFAEYVLSREESVHILPAEVSLLAGALTEPLACCVHGGLDKTQIQPGETVLVFGPGAMGFFMSQVAKAAGAKVVLAGVREDEQRLLWAQKFGWIDTLVNQDTQDLKSIIADITGGEGAAKIFECSGSVQALNKGIEMAGRKGDIIQLGLFKEPYNRLRTDAFFPKELRFIGSRTQNPKAFRTTLKLMQEKRVTPDLIVTEILPLADWQKGFEDLSAKKQIKVVMKVAS